MFTFSEWEATLLVTSPLELPPLMLKPSGQVILFAMYKAFELLAAYVEACSARIDATYILCA